MSATLRGQTLHGFRLRRVVRHDALGAIWVAVHPMLGDKGLVRVISRQLASPVRAARLAIDGARLQRLALAVLPELLAFGELTDGSPYRLTPFSPAPHLDELVERIAQLDIPERMRIVASIGKALGELHGAGLVHGVLTPQRVQLDAAGHGSPRPRLLDSGLGSLDLAAAAAGDGPLAHWAAPELLAGAPPTVRSDVYAFGRMARVLLVAPAELRTPRHRRSEQLADCISTETQLWPAARRALRRATASDPMHRFCSVEQVTAALERADVRRRRPGLPALQHRTGGHRRRTLQQWELGGERVAARPAGVFRASVDAASIPARSAELAAAAHGRGPMAAHAPATDEPSHHAPTVAPESPPGSRLLRRALSVGARTGAGAFVVAAGLLLAYRAVAGQWPGDAARVATVERGELIVTSRPAGAVVRLDGRELSVRTPVRVRLERGRPHTLTLHRRGYRSWTQDVALGRQEQHREIHGVLVEEAPRWGTLKLGSDRPADFFLDTRRVGAQRTELTVGEVRAGVDHRLRVVAAGCPPTKRSFRVPAGKVLVLDFAPCGKPAH